jgi:pyroglutamyl-peptidase
MHLERPSLPVVLLTGFEPFGGDVVNPSELAVRALDGLEVEGHRIVTGLLPTVFGAAREVLDVLIDRHRPVLVVGIGQAGGRAAVSFERIAINVDDARIADNAGAQPLDLPVVPGGPAAYFSTLPIKAMRQACEDAGVPAEVSQTAGTFVCNHAFYGLMHRLAHATADRAPRGGFVHVPWLPGQGVPNLPLDAIQRGLRAAITAALRHTGADLSQHAGATH